MLRNSDRALAIFIKKLKKQKEWYKISKMFAENIEKNIYVYKMLKNLGKPQKLDEIFLVSVSI